MDPSNPCLWITMDFPERLMRLRKERNLSQKALAERVEVHIKQIQRYENGSSQPTLDIIRRLATTLAVSTDELIFGEDERGPDDQLKLQFEALRQFNDQEKLVAKKILDSLILKHTANRLAS